MWTTLLERRRERGAPPVGLPRKPAIREAAELPAAKPPRLRHADPYTKLTARGQLNGFGWIASDAEGQPRRVSS
jgi:hypothetical protein